MASVRRRPAPARHNPLFLEPAYKRDRESGESIDAAALRPRPGPGRAAAGSKSGFSAAGGKNCPS